MDFLRLHLPGLHQALRGALDSFSTIVSYLLGDEVPTAERREAPAAEELGEVAAGKPGRTGEEEAQEALAGIGGGHSAGAGGLRGPGEAGRHQEGIAAIEQTWSWGEGSCHSFQGEKQDTGVWEAAKTSRCRDISAPSEARKKSEAGCEAGRDWSSQAQEHQECNEQEVSREETPRTWEQAEEEEEEEEEVRSREPAGASGEESDWTWPGEPEGKASASADGQKVAGDGREPEQAVKETVAERIRGAGPKEAEREEEAVVVVTDDQSARAQGTQEPGAGSEDGATLGRGEGRRVSDKGEARTTSGEEEAWTTSGREGADLPGVGETEHGAIPGDWIPEGTGRVWVLEEEMGENREAEASLFLKQAQSLGTGGVGEAAEDQTAGREAAECQGSEWEAGESFEGQADQDGEEANGRQDSEVRAAEASLEEVARAPEAKQERESRRAIAAGLSQDEVANEAEGDADFEATPEAGPDQEFREERNEAEAQVGREELGGDFGGPESKVTEGQEPEPTGGLRTPVERPEEGQQGEGGLCCIPASSQEETDRSLGDNARDMGYVKPDAEACENQGREGIESGNAQEEKVGPGQEEAAGGRESAPPEVPEAGRQWKKAEEAGCGPESQELAGGHGAEGGTGQTLGESDAADTKDEEVEAPLSREADRTPRRGWRLEDREGTWVSSLAAGIVENKAASDERVAGPGAGPEREAGGAWDGAFGSGRDSQGREEASRGEDLVGAAGGEDRAGQEFGLEGSAAEEEAADRRGQGEAFEAEEGEPGGGWAEVGESVAARGSCGTSSFFSGSPAVEAAGTVAVGEAEGLEERQMLLGKEAGLWHAREQGRGSEGQCADHSPDRETRAPRAVGDGEVTGLQRAEAEQKEPEGLEDTWGRQGQSTDEDAAEAAAGPRAEAAGSAGAGACGSWSEVLLPGSRLDVSAPRSRALLSRNSLHRRSRPSFRWSPTPERQEEPAGPPPEKELSAPADRLLQPEGPPEPSPPRPEGTPVPARRKPLGHGFGLAHSGMMQELQARLGQPKPQ